MVMKKRKIKINTRQVVVNHIDANIIVKQQELIAEYTHTFHSKQDAIRFLSDITPIRKAIRKLTEREVFRLMGVDENDIDKIQTSGISRSQQYKLAGNSIVVQCMEGIFYNLFSNEQQEQTTLF